MSLPRVNSILYGLSCAIQGFIKTGAAMYLVNEIVNYVASMQYNAPVLTSNLQYNNELIYEEFINQNEQKNSQALRTISVAAIGSGLFFVKGVKEAELKAEQNESLPLYIPLTNF